MSGRTCVCFAPLLLAVIITTGAARAAEPAGPRAIVAAKDGSLAERLAAKEIARYLYLRTGVLVPIVEVLPERAPGGLIVVGVKDRPAVKAEKDATNRKRLAREEVLPIRKELVRRLADVHRHLLESTTTTGAMGNVANWQQHVIPMLLAPSSKDLESLLGEPLPADALPGRHYEGRPRLFVPVVRTMVVAGEPLKLTARLLGIEPAEAAVHWRRLGRGEFAKTPLAHVARGVYRVTLPAEAVKADLEYYVSVTSKEGKTLVFPATAPRLNQTVIVVDLP